MKFNCFRKLKGEVKIQRDETIGLRKALQECKACKIKKPECGDDPPPCFPSVECRDTYDGPVCGPCPQGYKGDGRVIFISYNNLMQNRPYSTFNCLVIPNILNFPNITYNPKCIPKKVL